jgi:hypothetical protein
VPSGGANGRGRLDKNKTSQQKKLAPAEAKNAIVTVDVITRREGNRDHTSEAIEGNLRILK